VNTSESLNFSRGSSEALNCRFDSSPSSCIEIQDSDDTNQEEDDQNQDQNDEQNPDDQESGGGSTGGSGGGSEEVDQEVVDHLLEVSGAPDRNRMNLQRMKTLQLNYSWIKKAQLPRE